MTLRAKFAVLLGLIGASVVVALALSWWSLDTMHSEVREPMRSLTDVLKHLGSAKQSIESAATLMSPQQTHDAPLGVRTPAQEFAPQAPESQRELAAARLDHALGQFEALVNLESSRTRLGTGMLSNLQSRLFETRHLIAQDPQQPIDQLTRKLFELHELIERAEAKLVDDTQLALRHGVDVRHRLGVLLAIVLLITALCIALGLSLIRRWVLSPVQNLRSAAARFAAGDLTYRLHAPENSQQRDELAQLAREFNQMASMIRSLQDERVEREKLAAIGEMMRRLVHNLRNPLGGIRGLAELTRSELPTTDTDLREIQGRIIATVDRFERWLNDLLRVTRPAQVHPIKTEVRQWLQGLVETHHPSAQTRGVTFSLNTDHAPNHATFDPSHLEHALSALISNALEACGHDGEGGRIELLARETGQTWELRVTDSGPGIPESLHEQVFAPYFTTKPEGTGIGLASVVQVVRAHDGQVWIDTALSPQNGDIRRPGASFVIRLPLAGPSDQSGRMVELASMSQSGAVSGQDSGHRG